MFIRKNPTQNFTIIPNAIINSDISIIALGIYTKMRSKPKDWVLNPNNMAKECGLNIKTFYKYLKELYNNNIIQRVQKRENGKFSNEVNYIFKNECECHNEDIEIDINTLEKKQVEKIKQSCMDILKNEKIEIPKNDIYNNTYSTKEEEKKEKNIKKDFYFILNANETLNKCTNYLQSLKENRKKTKINEEQEEYSFLSKLNEEQQKAYKDFIAYRSENKKISYATKRLIRNKIQCLINDNMDITTIVQESILKGWLGLYPKKTHKTTNKIQSQNTLFNYLDFDKKLDDFFDKVMAESGFKKEITK